MLVRTDDEVYRVDSVWLGPPRATFPWRARYVSYGIGLLVMILMMFLQRRVGIGLDFFSVAWALVLTVLVTRFLGQRIDYERPLGQVLALLRQAAAAPTSIARLIDRLARHSCKFNVRALRARPTTIGARARTSEGLEECSGEY